VHRKIISPLTAFVTLRILARAIKWIHNPDTVNGKPTLIVSSLLRKHDVFWAFVAQLRNGRLVSERVTLPPHLLWRCRVIAFTKLKQEASNTLGNPYGNGRIRLLGARLGDDWLVRHFQKSRG
jgi:hypothetical protein